MTILDYRAGLDWPALFASRLDLDDLIVAQWVPVGALPPGWLGDAYRALVRDLRTPVPVALRVGCVNDFAVYIGYPALAAVETRHLPPASQAWAYERLTTIDGAADFGDKLSEAEARALFPGLEAYGYRD